MTLEVRCATDADRAVLSRMLELYQHDLSDIWPQDLDQRGEYGYQLDKYFGHGKRAAAFIFLVDGKLAGLALVDDAVSLPENELWMSQFFVMKKYRRQGVGHLAAQRIFDSMPGRWEVGQMQGNQAATCFWRAVIGSYCAGRFVEYELDDERWRGLLQCFDNSSTRRQTETY